MKWHSGTQGWSEFLARPTSKLRLPAIGLLFLFVVGPVAGWAQSTIGIKPELVLQTAHTSLVRSIAISPDGRWLAGGSSEYNVKVWNVQSGLQVRNIAGFNNGVVAMAFSADSKWLATASPFEHTVVLWELATGQKIGTLEGHHGAVWSMAASADGRWLATGSTDKTVGLWDLATRKNLRFFTGFTDDIFAVAFSPDSRRLVAACRDKTVKSWEVPSGREVGSAQLLGHADNVVAVGFRPNAQWMAAGTYYNSVKLWNNTNAVQVPSLSLIGHTNYVRSAAFSTDGRLLASGAQDNNIKVWDASTGHLLHTLKGHTDLIEALTFTSDGRHLASASWDNSVGLWDTTTGQEERTFGGRTYAINSVAFSPDGHRVAAASNDGTIKLWELNGGSEPRILTGHSSWIGAVKFSSDGRWLASVSGNNNGDNTARVWEVGTWRQVCTVRGQPDLGVGLAFSRDGRWFAVGGGYDDKTVKIWDLANCTQARLLKGHTHRIDAVEFSPDGRLLATASLDKTVKLWEVSTGRLVRSIRPFNDSGLFPVLAFSRDGTRLAIGSQENATVKLWEVGSERPPSTLEGHLDGVHSLAFLHDGAWLASGSFDSTVRLWDAASGTPLRTLHLPADTESKQVAITSDERWMAVANDDGSTRIWDFAKGQERVALVSLWPVKDWVAVAPDGLFDGTADAMQQVAWRAGNTLEVTSLDSFFNDFYYPGLWPGVLAEPPPAATVDIATAVQIPGLRTMLAEKQAHIEVRKGDALVCFEQVPGVAVQAPAVDDAERPLEANGYRVAPNDPTCKYQKELPAAGKAGESVASLQNWKPPVFTTPWDGKPSDVAGATLHVLSVGVAQYPAESGFDPLPYAVSSAKAVEDFFTAQGRTSQTPYARVRVWPGLYDAAATRGAIRNRLREIAQAATEDDVVLLYLAGHGAMVPGEEMFYFVSADAKDRNIRGTGLNTAMLAEGLRDIPARRIVLIIDACQSGGAVEALSKIGEVKARGEQVRAQSEAHAGRPHEHSIGIHIIAATLPLSYAAGLQADRSALAATLLDALKAPGQVTMNSAVEYLKGQLPDTSFKTINFRQVPLTSSIGLDFVITRN